MSTVHPEAPTVVQEPPAADGLVGELLARRRKRLPLLTLALIVLVAAAAAFTGGVEVQKHWGKASASASSPFQASFARAFAGGGLPSFTGGGGTTGTVTLVRGTTLYVTTADGNTILVKTSTASRVSKAVTSSVGNIHPGDSVTVVGQQNTDGSVTARRLTIGGTNG